MTAADDRYVAFAALRDLVAELRRDVEDGRGWDGATRDEQIRRLAALVDALTPLLT